MQHGILTPAELRSLSRLHTRRLVAASILSGLAAMALALAVSPLIGFAAVLAACVISAAGEQERK
jgi:hypothetical protein